ncbi:CG18171 [Drosophila busckii]|uniref:CG18171 n=1 Tax=Drosophila busckii TaxID=30019 RepID=A0A0M4EE88_DROBS|nr:CG18171 [Drosophila busckii]
MTSGYSKSNASEARRESRNARNAARQLLRDLREEKKAEHERRKRARSLLNKVPEVVKSKKKKKKPKTIKDVFNMEVPPEPEDHELNIYDRRNQEKLVRRHKRYDYPAKDCHHIDLSFVRYFDKLVSLTLEFMGPKMERGYHKRHLNFSYDDMRRLAKGLRTLLQLRVFRLRNSRMDNLKLLILTRAINQLDNLEVLDFGYDQLTDNCDVALKMLLDRSCMYKALELEYNRLDRSCLEAISNSLRKHRGNALEYLGLAHNPLSNAGLTALVHNLVGTNHVQELNIAGIETSPEHTANELSFLLRNHKPLRSLNMVAIALNPKVGRELICGLVTNNKLTHFDCRGCDLDVQQELEADLIVRRNNYRLTHPYVENDEHTEEMVLQFLADSRHPIIQNLLNKDAQMEECLRNRPAFLPSEESVEEEERLVEEEEMDIWAILGIKNPNAAALAPDLSMDDDNDDDYLPPVSTNTFAVPQESELLVEYELYRPSPACRRLRSEHKRGVYSEAFIENERLGTLADLCVRALAKLGTRYIAPQVRDDPSKLRIHYDALDVNLPLQDCYFVDDVHFWRRVVLAKSTDHALQLKRVDEYDWKGMGISLKYVELVEACSASYWPEERMAHLGQLVRQFVRTMHIRHLQSLPEHAFSHYVDSEEELDVTSELSLEPEISSDEKDTEDEEEECEEEEEAPAAAVVKAKKESDHKLRVKVEDTTASTAQSSIMSMAVSKPDEEEDDDDNDEAYQQWQIQQMEQLKRRDAREARNAARQLLRDLRAEKVAEHQRRREIRALMRKLPIEAKPKRKRKAKQGKIKSVFDLVVEPEPDDGDDQIPDKRNKEKLLRRLKRYDYPAKHCHHIDLSFVRYFDRMISLTLEFLGPDMERDYHKRHMNFSYDDMQRLARGLQTLKQLKVFRLRNSRMDSIKLLILARALKQLDELEMLDFGYDQLQDDCAVGLEMLLDRKQMIKALELEYNKLGQDSLVAIGTALKQHENDNPDGSPLEYLGLAHNPLNDLGIQVLVHNIVGTKHVQELNISGTECSPGTVAHELSNLLRRHAPLRRLDMVAIPLCPSTGRQLICGLEVNHKILHFDCRGCDLDLEQEFEADIIVRRNNYELQHSYLGDETQTEQSILEHLASIKHPIVAKLMADMERRAECIKERPTHSTTELSVEEEKEVEKEEEFDIWKMLGVRPPSIVVQDRVSVYASLNRSSIHRSGISFKYKPNEFNLDEFREHVDRLGPMDRHYYLQRQREY